MHMERTEASFGVGTAVGDDIRVRLSDNSNVDIDLSDTETVQDVPDAITEADDDLTAELNADGTGIDLSDTAGGGSNLRVTALNSSDAAADLGILATGSRASSKTQHIAMLLPEAIPSRWQSPMPMAAGKQPAGLSSFMSSP